MTRPADVLCRSLIVALSAIGLSAAAPPDRWIGAWTSAQVPAGPQHLLDPSALDDVTLREIVHVSAGGAHLRVRLSNVFGRQPLRIDSAHVARAEAPASPRILSDTDRVLTFGGQQTATIAPGQELWSDPVDLPVSAFADLAVSLHFPASPDRETGHADTQATSFSAPGDQSGAADLIRPTPIDHWYHLSAIETDGGADIGSIVALGDSITDSYMSHVDGNDRWPDLLARRLRDEAGVQNPSVLNQGVAGNRVLTEIVGPRLLDRLERDLFSLPDVRTVILLEGINDIGSLTREHPASPAEHKAFVARLIAAYRTIVAQAHRRGIRVIGGTIMPFVGSTFYHPDTANEADRQHVNAWIRTPGHFDGMIDFDRATRDPAHPGSLLPAYDSGDHIHPSVAGYHAMAAAIPLRLLLRR